MKYPGKKAAASPKQKLSFLLLLIPLYLISSTAMDHLEVGIVGSVIARAGTALAALGILFLLPGVFLPFIFFRRKTMTFFEYLSWSVGLNWLFLLFATSAIKITGSPITRLNLLTVIIPATVIAALAGSHRQTLTVQPAARKLLTAWAAVMIVILILSGIIFRPFLLSEEGFWPIEYNRILDEISFPGGEEPPEGIQIAIGANWEKEAFPLLEPTAESASFQFFNPDSGRRLYSLLFLLDSREETEVEIIFNGKKIGRRYLHPPYRLELCPRNYPPAKEIFSRQVNLLPGENVIEFMFSPGGDKNFTGKPQISVWNFCGFNRDKFLKYFNSRYLIADTGDLREQLNLARNLRRRVLPFTYSYDGVFFDGGGYTIEHPPFPFILKMLMLVLGENNLQSFQILFWGLLAFLLMVLLAGTTESARGGIIISAVFFGIVCFISLFLIPYRTDTPYIAPTLSVCVIVSFYHLQRRRTALFFLWALFAILSKGGILFIGVGIAAFALVNKEWRYPAKLLVFCLLLALITLGPSFFATRQDTTPNQWKVLLSGNYGDRFAPLLDIFSGNGRAIRLLGQSALRYLLLTGAGSGFLLLAWFLKKTSRSTFFIIAAFFSFLLIAFSRPSLISGDYSGHRLSYLAPVNFLIAIPAVAALVEYRGKFRKMLLASTLIISMSALLFVPPILRGYREAITLLSRETAHRAAVIDFLIRRKEGDRDLIREVLDDFLTSLEKENRQLCRRLGRRLKAAGFYREAGVLFRTAAELENRIEKPPDSRSNKR